MKHRRGRFALIVLDGVGIGACRDQAQFGDQGSDTLGNIARAVGGLELPNLADLGLGCCRPVSGLKCQSPRGAHGVALPASPGKDSTTGHWEMCGLITERPFPTYPLGFPLPIITAFDRATGRHVLCNRPASGTAVIEEFGAEHLKTGAWIVYTSADSVFQVAAHEDVISLDDLHIACRILREEILVGDHAVARVIARPFVGEPGSFRRTANRRDYSLPPPRETLLDRLEGAAVPRVGVGKVDDLFAHRGITSRHAATNAETYRLLIEALDQMEWGFLFANVVEFDQSWGHRNDVAGFYQGLRELDAAMPELVSRLRGDDILVLTADHGNDPTTPSTDHSREAVPVLVTGPGVRPVSLGTRRTFADLGRTAAEYFGVSVEVGTSFLGEIGA